MTCPRCQHENPPPAKFCLECGSRLAPTCGQCGTALPASAKFHGWVIVQASLVSYGEATPYLPVIDLDLLKGYLKIQDQDDPRAIREKVTGKLLTVDEAFKPTVPAFLALLDVPVDDAAFDRWKGMMVYEAGTPVTVTTLGLLVVEVHSCCARAAYEANRQVTRGRLDCRARSAPRRPARGLRPGTLPRRRDACDDRHMSHSAEVPTCEGFAPR